jgi:hypothetical protein
MRQAQMDQPSEKNLISEYLPDDPEGRQIYGLVKDPHPGKGREYKDQALDSELNLIS